MSRFIYSDENKRFNTLFYFNTHKFGGRVYKAPIDAGFTCPNIDGRKGTGGCIYCGGGSGYFTEKPTIPTEKQLEIQKELIRAKHPNARIIAYFQSYSNTYAQTAIIRSRIEPVLSDKDVAGISIATRADCISAETLGYLTELSKRTALTVELGLQTVHDETALAINRCHSFNEFIAGYSSLKAAGIRVCVHIINGLPGEDEKMMLETARTLGKLRPDGVKIHLLHVVAGTKLAETYLSGGYEPMEREDYVRIVCKQLCLLPEETVIERLTGDGVKNETLAPAWSKDKISVLGAIDKYMAENDLVQGQDFH